MFKEEENQERLSGKKLPIASLEWILDSGASHHMTSNIIAINDLCDLPQAIYILIPNGIVVKVKQAGTVNLRHGLVQKNVLYSPEFKCNLISVQQLTYDKNCIIIYGAQCCLISGPHSEDADWSGRTNEWGVLPQM